MKKLITLTLMTLLMAVQANVHAQKYVGGDISLVPAYEAAGDVWLDAQGNAINTYYYDGMISYVKDVAGWNAVRVRLLVDPSQDSYVATCQDLNYVKALGKRIKDAGMSFLLDIFYSDTWTDVSQQWIPASWGYDKNTDTETLATKVKSYTTEVLNALVSAGATPDFIQLGNEVSYGMLWDNATGKSKNNYFSTGMTYDGQSAKIIRFANLLKAGADGVRSSNNSSAQIVLHCERTGNSDQARNFYSWIGQAGFTDYDIIGLSYYPLWHGDLNSLKATLSALQTAYPDKQIHIVEAGYHNTSFTVGERDYDTSGTWPYSPDGQASFLADLIATLNGYSNVTGLYYWQPEECGNGADDGGTNRVMDNWDQRGFWQLTWKSGQHKLISEKALMTLNTFIGGSGYQGTEEDENDITSKFTNMDFETGNDTGWTVNYDGWDNGPWPATDGYYSSLVTNYAIKGWTGAANNLSAGEIFYQSVDNLPAGTYTVSAVVYTDYDGIYLFANSETQEVTVSPSWGTAYEVSVTTTLTETGSLSLGLKLLTKPTQTSAVNLYADNFKVSCLATGMQNIISRTTANNRYYTLDGRMLKSKPTTRGIYIHNGIKVVIK